MADEPRHIALFFYGLTSGGAPRRALTLAGEFARRGHRVDLVVAEPRGPLSEAIPHQVNLVGLQSRWTRVRLLAGVKRFQVRAAVFALAAYLRRERPHVLLSAANSAHLTAVVAHGLAGVDTRLVLRACTHLTRIAGNGKQTTRPVLRLLARRFYPRADALIAGSEEVAADLVRVTGISRSRIAKIYNPVVSPELAERASQPLDHPWFAAGSPPVILGAGRLVKQKDFPTLIDAFAKVRAGRPARLVILGEAKNRGRRDRLIALAERRGVGMDVALPGLVQNPYSYMARAAVFVLSSAWEGLPGVLIEAMACGCPVVSTDAPGGSAEALDGGRYGPLVPVGDATALAKAIRSVLDLPPDRERLRQWAAAFTVEASVAGYLSVLLAEGDAA